MAYVSEAAVVRRSLTVTLDVLKLASPRCTVDARCMRAMCGSGYIWVVGEPLMLRELLKVLRAKGIMTRSLTWSIKL